MKPTLLQQKARPKKPLWREYGEALLVALVLALVIRTFVVQAFKIPSESMLQTLLVGDHLLASKFAYGIKIPFTDTYVYKGDDPARGDVIEVRNKQLYRNGQPVKESYIRFADPDGVEPVRDNYGPVTVPPNKYFVMGDNRDNSLDSRFWGFVDRSAIRAKAWRIYWSWGGLDDIRWGRIGQQIH